MVTAAVVAAAVAPGVALLAYVYWKDRFATEPVRLVFRLFAAGMFVVFPTMVVQRMFVVALEPGMWTYAFGISALAEEFVKWFVFVFTVYRHREFDEPYDGIVYAAAVSLGFATLENVLYALSYRTSFADLFFRALLPVSGHALFGIAMGYSFGQAKFAGSRRAERLRLLFALAVPWLWHGAFDAVLLADRDPWELAVFMAICWGYAGWKLHRANARSPYHPTFADDEVRM